MPAAALRDKIISEQEVTQFMSGRPIMLYMSDRMRDDMLLVQAYLEKIEGAKKHGRAHAVELALEEWWRDIQAGTGFDRAFLESMIEEYGEMIEQPRQPYGVFFTQKRRDTAESIGMFLELLDAEDRPAEDRIFIPQLQVIKGSESNKTLITFFALRRLAERIRRDHPDLQVEDDEGISRKEKLYRELTTKGIGVKPLSVSEIADLTGYDRQTILNEIKAERLSAIKGEKGAYIIQPNDLLAWLKKSDENEE